MRKLRCGDVSGVDGAERVHGKLPSRDLRYCDGRGILGRGRLY